MQATDRRGALGAKEGAEELDQYVPFLRLRYYRPRQTSPHRGLRTRRNLWPAGRPLGPETPLSEPWRVGANDYYLFIREETL